MLGAGARRDIVVIGASIGGVPVLMDLAAALPPDFPAAILIVQHVGAHPSILPELLRAAGPNRAVHPESGTRVEPGVLYIAPPDRHMLIEGDCIRLTREAKENHARPAIDPLFRSAAVTHGPRAIGVILSGRLDDGTAGLQAIKACGGLVLVQDPNDAEESSMPTSAMDNVAVDAVVTRASLARVLLAHMGEPVATAPVHVPAAIACEHSLSLHEGNDMDDLDSIGAPSKIVCPDCNGVLWEIRDARPKRYRCHTGHAYTVQTLNYLQAVRADEALWKALRALHERESLLRDYAASNDSPEEAGRLEAEAEHVAQHALQLQRMIAGE